MTAKSERPQPRPTPQPTPTSQPFWDGARKRKLMLQYDPSSRMWQFWPRECSVRTGKRNLRWRETSGKGAIYAFTTAHQPAAGFEGKAPYVLGLIDLDEGVRIIGNLRGVKAEDVEIGMRVKVAWEKMSEEINYFVFKPDRSGST